MALERTIEEFQDDLARAADAFMSTGLKELHRKGPQAHMQVALVNIAIACELLIKAFLSQIGPSLVFSDLSPEDMVAFQAPQLFSGGKKSSAEMRLRFRDFKSRDFADCLAMLFSLKPELKTVYGSNLQRISRIRNGGVHSAIASHSIHDVDRAAYVVLKLHETIGKGSRSLFVQSKDDVEFLRRFDATRSERVKKALEEARKKFHSADFKEVEVLGSGWEQLSVPCPICDCEGLLLGDTDYDVEASGPEDYDDFLTFCGTSFECDACGLSLKDEEELRLAGIEATRDRSDDLESWHTDHDGPEPDYYNED